MAHRLFRRGVTAAAAILLLAACTSPSPGPASAAPHALSALADAAERAQRAGDGAAVARMAQSNRYVLRDLLGLLDDRALAEVPGSDEAAQAIAVNIERLTGDGAPRAVIARMRAWSASQRAAARRARASLSSAEAAFAQGRFADAVGAADEVLAIALPLEDHRGTLAAFRVAGQAERRLARYDAAAGRHERALAIARRAGDRYGEAQALIDRGDVRERRKDHAAAERDYAGALALLGAPEDWKEAGRALRQAGDVQVAQARFAEAALSYERALVLAQAAGDAERIAEAGDYLGYFARQLGDVEGAVRRHQASLAAAAGIDDPAAQSRAIARAGNHLGLCYAAIAGAAAAAQDRVRAAAAYARATSYLDQALEAARAVADQWREGYILRALAFVKRDAADLADPAVGARLLGESLASASAALSAARAMAEREWEGLALHHAAVTEARLGRLAEAGAHFGEALAIWRAIGDRRSLGEAHRLMALELHERSGLSGEALASYDAALTTFDAIEARDEMSAVLYRKGLLLERTGDLDGALAAHGRAIELLESIRGRLTLQEHKLSFFSVRLKPYEAYVGLAVRLYRKTGLLRHGEGAFAVSERARARTLLDLIERGRGRIRAGVDAPTLAREAALQSSYAGLVQQLQQARDPDAAAALRAQLDAAERDLTAFVGELRERHGRYAQLRALDTVGVGDVRDRILGPADVLLEYFVTAEETHAFVLGAEGLRAVETLPVGWRALAAQVEALRRPFEELKAGGDMATLEQFDLERAHALYRSVVGPVARHLRGADNLVIVPHGPLFYVPFELLPTEAPAARADGEPARDRFERARFLVEDAPPISYALSATLLDPRLAEPAKAGMAGRTFLGVGNPMGDSSDDRMGNGLKGADAALQPLPFAEEEVRTVLSIFGADAKAYLRAEATKERFMAEAPGFRLLLLSTHGVIDEDDPMMSGLVFARRPGADSYERLRTHEVFDIPLAADLVVLSACEVGLGKLVNGEGLLGLGRAFQYAGARSLLVTLWSVEDRATSELMVAFFEALHARGGRPAEALRAAKLKLMRARRQGEDGDVSLAHPFFWAPFVLIGPPVLSR